MNKNLKVTPSSQVDVLLPNYVVENYDRFVSFMETAAQSEERVGFGQDILQNLQRYRNLDTYKNTIVRSNTLKANITADADELCLVDGFGFPEENGVLLIDDEVILYQTREDNIFYGLQRGAAGTTVLPTFRSTGTYVKTVAEAHNVGSEVTNLSVLFLVAMLDNIHKSLTPNISSARINDQVNRSNLIQNIRDFFASKGSKLGIKALFKMIFGATDIDVTYPGDRMINPSESTWANNTIIRVIPWAKELTDQTKNYGTPDKLIGAELQLKTFPEGEVLSRTICDYVSTYPFGSEMQYEIYTSPNTEFVGFTVTNTTLARQMETEGVNNNEFDVYTVTVESTAGFPPSGIFFVGSEGIKYQQKTQTQFLGCTRGFVSVIRDHNIGDRVYGAYYLEGTYQDENGVEYTSRSWPTGIVTDVSVDKPGLLSETTDNIILRTAGEIDNRDPALDSFIINETFSLISTSSDLPYYGDRTYGVSNVYFNDKQIFVASANISNHTIGPFGEVGDDLVIPVDMHTFPRRSEIRENSSTDTLGVGTVGVAIDGVPFYSNISKDILVSGSISEVKIANGGTSYINPTVLVSDGNAEFTPTVTNGTITNIDITTNDHYTTVPTIRVTSGESGVIDLTFDNYGRITSAVVSNGGKYYNDTPLVRIVDSSRRGRGALVRCTASAGSIDTVEIAASGIDYNPDTTTAVIVPIGSGAELEANVQSWQFNLVAQIQNDANNNFDDNNGFLFEDNDGVQSRYGYAIHPKSLLEDLGDTAGTHSPIVGWAWDGNPIYGPYGYTNGVDDSDGITSQLSGYVLEDDRSTITPLNSSSVASMPPSTTTYPMGTFLQDYTYDPERAGLVGYVTQENGGKINHDGGGSDGEPIQIDTSVILDPDSLLDRSNGKVCNTPEYPAELYPDGVYCYFITTFGVDSRYPYVIGHNFKNDPATQMITLSEGGTTTTPTNQGGTYTKDKTDIDFTEVELHRTGDLGTIDSSIDIEISSVGEGSVSSIFIENGGPNTNVVGDLLYFDDTGTDGQGAEGIITLIEGRDITSTGSELILTPVVSHRQRINLADNAGEFVFNTGAERKFRTSSGAEFLVESYDQTTKILIVNVTTQNLVQFGDIIFDSRNTQITIGDSRYGNQELSGTIVGGTSTFLSQEEPTADVASPGDLWWSAETKRLYIYYSSLDPETTPQTGDWVTTQPIGTRPFIGAIDTGVGNTSPTGGQSYSSPQAENKVTISTQAPAARTDGSPNVRGDLWFSTHTGILYIWNSDTHVEYFLDQQERSAEWVATDPFASVSTAEASAYTEWATGTVDPREYSQTARVLISEASPATMDDGSALSPGVLWWSPLTGKMYIYLNDGDSSQWVVTNPTGTISGEGSLNYTLPGDGAINPDAISIIDELPTATQLWVENTKHFKVGDTIHIQVGAPGTDLSEEAVITQLSKYTLGVTRGQAPVDIPNGAKIYNKSRFLYKITTTEPHGLYAGDKINLQGSSQTGFNGEYEIAVGGVVKPAVGTATISGGAVTGVTINASGAGYPNDTRVTFYGGDGQGAYGIATAENGSLTGVTITEGGNNYTFAPNVVFNSRETNTEFYFYVPTEYASENGLYYSSSSQTVQGIVAAVEMNSTGYGYTKMPRVLGIYKRSIDRANTKIKLEGTTIGSVDVISGGRRYVNPIAIFDDLTGSGSGAEAIVGVIEGRVVSITVTNAGTGYVEPVLTLVEASGKYLGITNDIGAIKAFEVSRPGRTVANDRRLNPEIEAITRLIVTPTDANIGTFLPDQVVYQGIDEYRLATARVFSYDSERQILALNQVDGVFNVDEVVYNEDGAEATVLVSGQSVARLLVGSVATNVGRFIDDKSKISTSYAVTQDSNEYQWFSYKIASPLQQVQYETFVRDIVHPTGFALFSDVRISDEAVAPTNVIDIDITIE